MYQVDMTDPPATDRLWHMLKGARRRCLAGSVGTREYAFVRRQGGRFLNVARTTPHSFLLSLLGGANFSYHILKSEL